jgi:peptidoglycan-N-acetylglucosamine deacetylase
VSRGIVNFWRNRKRWGLLILTGCFSVSLLLTQVTSQFVARAQQGSQNLSEMELKAGNKEKIIAFESAMNSTWEKEAESKGIFKVPKRFKSVTLSKAKLRKPEKIIALTFDDGPYPQYTYEVLDILKKNNIKATFFLIGRNLAKHPEIAKRVAAEGHVIANHTWSHSYKNLSEEVSAKEVNDTAALIEKVTGVKTTLFRPPGGILTNGPADYAKKKGYTIVMWSADSVDYSRPGLNKLINNIMSNSGPGGITLFHDGGGNRSQTVEALPKIISKFKAQGYRFATIPDLLQMQDKQLKELTAKK